MAQTLCERNSQMIVGCSSLNVLDFRRISSEELQSQAKTLTYSETQKPAFLDIEVGFAEKLLNEWNERGLLGVVETINKTPKVHPTIINVTLKLYGLLANLEEWKNSKKKMKCPVDGFSKKIFACHPHTTRLAIILENKVKVLCMNGLDSNNEIILKDKRVQKISCLAWRPKSAMSLAVGSTNGVLVWLLDPNFTNKRPGGISTTRFLQSPNMQNEISSISWSPCGKLLACTCVNSTSLWIWNILSQSDSAIQRVGSDLSLVEWSPCGQRLITATYSSLFRVWESKTFDDAKWTDLNGRCTSACWSLCGSYLLFTVANEPFIYYSQFYSKTSCDSIDIGGSGVALKCADVSSFANQLDEDIEIEKQICFLIDMVWDPTNSRLAVLFKDGKRNRIALYHTRIDTQVHLVPCGYVTGEEDEEGKQIEFLNGFEKGAILAVYWSSGSMSLIPLYFNQNLTSPSLENVRKVKNIGHTNPSSISFLHHTMDESLLNSDLSVTNDFSIFSSVE